MLDQQSVAQLLSHTDLFSGLAPAHLEAIAKITKVVMFEAKTTVVRQGEGGSELYILANGSVAVVREDATLGIEHVVKELRAPEFFGEMSLLSGSPRAATIRTLEDTACVVLAAASYESLLEKIPAVAVQISRYLAQRLDHQMSMMGFRFVNQEQLIYDSELYATFSEGLLHRLKAIPLRLDGSTLTIALTRPHDAATVNALRQELPGLGLQPVACAEEDYEAFVARYLAEPSMAMSSPAPNAEFRFEDGTSIPSPFGALLGQIAQARGRVIVEIANDVSLWLVTPSGSLEPLHFSLSDGDRRALEQQLQDLLRDEGELEGLRRFTVFANDRRCDVNLSRLRTLRGFRYSVGLTDPHNAVPLPATLWPSEALRANVEAAVRGSGGVVLVVGAGHSGRSTTLYSMLRMLERDGMKPNVITLESEPLLSLDRVAQVRLGGQLGGQCESDNLFRMMKVALHQGPDVMLVDEPRVEDIGQLLEAAEDGLTVLTTVKGEDPLSALITLRDRDTRTLAHSENLRLVLGQQLLRRICRQCRQEYSPSPAVLSQLELSGLGTRTDRYYHGAGCHTCRGTGIQGRIANFELLQLNGLLTDMLRSGRPVDGIRKAAASHGLLFSFKSFARLLVLQGQILPTEALRLFGGVARA